ncbi:amidase [Paenibacillus ginsengarvi]|uniref:Amidase n=1 Tax=Paenibacillus ginsengarvi TaxID=400777 RepID=A0A3B0BZT0_9BACL|nr:amidase [Paenibacillus ginsengarvi]RKN79125.1 amidase [Paenibacillus ginsengarvi]
MSLLNRCSLFEDVQLLRRSDIRLHDYLNILMERFDRVEPAVRAFEPETGRMERLWREASDLSELYRDPDNKPPLFGILVGVKDMIHANGFPTKAGYNLPANALTGPEASIVSRLRMQGALLAGKTATEEFAYSSVPPTRNPHNLLHSPGGSSSGSAAAVAAGLVPLSIGTQTLRSVIAPASFCGVVGFKPSYGRIPTDGVLLLSPSFDTIGLFTQDVASMRYACSALVPRWRSGIERRAGHTVVGIPNGIYRSLLYEGTWSVFEAQIGRLQEAGFMVKSVDMPWGDDFLYGDAMLRMIQAEMALVHEQRFQSYRELYGPVCRSAIEKGQTVTPEELELRRRGQSELRRKLELTMDGEGIDLWVSPAQAGPAPQGYAETGRGGMTAIWTYAGLPSVSIPGAFLNGMPLGFQCIGAYGQDEELLEWAVRIEQTLKMGGR